MLVGIGIQIAQQLSGVNWILNYSANLGQKMGMGALPWPLILSTVFWVCTIPAFFLIDRLGRKFLLIWVRLPLRLVPLLSQQLCLSFFPDSSSF